MSRTMVWTTTATLHCRSVRSTQLLRISCRKCRSLLDIHQPCADRPYQFLATCARCGAWFRLETRPGDSSGILVSLPDMPPWTATEEPISPQPV